MLTKCAPKFVFFNEKKNRKDFNDFSLRKLTEIKFWHFLAPPHYTNSQNSLNSMISFGYVDFSQKSQFCIPPLKTPQLVLP